MRGFTLVHIFLGFLLYLTLCPRLHLPNKASALQALIQALLSRTQAMTDLTESNGLHGSLDHQPRDHHLKILSSHGSIGKSCFKIFLP